MIPFDFDYVKPGSISEAISIYRQWDSQGKEPKYYCGGTEIITMARLNQLQTKGIIDIKGIPECNMLAWKQDRLVIGSAVTLARVEEDKSFPLLSRVCNRVADQTSRFKITLGGNICGKIMYRETVLPLLTADATCIIATSNGEKQVSIHDVFAGELRLQPHEFLLQVLVDRRMTNLPFLSEKRTKIDRIGYPIVSIAAIHDEGDIRIAFSGVCSYPFRSKKIEHELNNQSISLENRISAAVNQLPGPILDDSHASAAFRTFIVRNLILDTIETFEGAHNE